MHRTGTCARHKAGRCFMEHDPAKVAVCTQWLQGACDDSKGCRLQHARRPELMPTCLYFLKVPFGCSTRVRFTSSLQGLCADSECPYVHVNLDAGTPVCPDFQRGYCPKGADCMQRHLSARQVKELKASQTLGVKV